MAMRIRQIHPMFWLSESVASVGFFERLLFQGLWGLSDREGLQLNKPAHIGAQAFPYDKNVGKDKVAAGIDALVKANLICIIRIDGVDDSAIFIPNFKKYQWVNKDEAKSRLAVIYLNNGNPYGSTADPYGLAPNPQESYSRVLEFKGSKSLDQNPPTPRKRVAVEGVREIVEYLNQVTGRGFSLERGNKFIEQAIRRGATVDECKEVIDRCWSLWRDKPDFVGKVDKSTPFREANFDRYLDEWRAGKANTGATGTKPKVVLSPEHQRLMEDLKKIAEDAGVQT